MEKILTIDWKSENRNTEFVKSLSTSGFAVIYNHGIDIDLISRTYQDWKTFFSSLRSSIRTNLISPLGTIRFNVISL